ncbi:helix-turn-helix transcriptional regulator [Enterobacteriaceae bacterium BIT-l23]|uniref:Helix-turn-helix domain-containing protein n=1 Tax=Jejubacter calystegiae TaxID=2579935 RepID=A0A4P8YPH2_9ENTR|nr:AraC family transcriptional regulator [Jejubacter calystegiae]NUU68249.1 helix-turn-helix transcriptional regulator [Enterobacteriaceae bacterium BIT-l23]QCT21888.1 helix-turn-helix domain-containing protein [Jejubacter calystegiae]
MEQTQLLEHILLNQRTISFNRMRHSSALYYHWHQCLEILWISKGYGIVVVDNQHYTARPGRLFIFPPFRLHKVQVDTSASNPYHRTTMHIDQSEVLGAMRDFPRQQHQFSLLSSSEAPAQICDLNERSAFVEQILGDFGALEREGSHHTSDVAFLVMQMMTFLPPRPEAWRPRNPTVSARIMAWVERHYSEKFSLDRLAQEIGLSRSYTSRLFRQQTGGSLHEYLLSRRIKRACELLRTTALPVEAIAAAVGFSDVTWFITSFKKMMNSTPLQYRKNITP